MPTIAHAVSHYTKYGTRGYDCHAVGHSSFYAPTMKEAKSWAKKLGLDLIKV